MPVSVSRSLIRNSPSNLQHRSTLRLLLADNDLSGNDILEVRPDSLYGGAGSANCYYEFTRHSNCRATEHGSSEISCFVLGNLFGNSFRRVRMYGGAVYEDLAREVLGVVCLLQKALQCVVIVDLFLISSSARLTKAFGKIYIPL